MLRNTFKIFLLFLLANSSLYAKPAAFGITTPDNALKRYLQLPEPITSPLSLIKVDYDKSNHVNCYQYTLASQHWPKADVSSDGTLWEHTLKIYRPDIINHDTALLFVSGGTRNPNSKGDNPPPAMLDFSHMANLTHSIIINLQDVPNQYLAFDDGIPRKEDGIVAYTWRRFLEAPEQGDTWPAHLPMTKAIIKAMDAIDTITSQEWKIKLNHYVVTGASKRGWATWLAALADNRISAIAPIVIDILNTRENIKHIYQNYGAWPPAFRDYVDAGITAKLDSPEFEKLTQIVDPLEYLQSTQGEHYKNRISIPKYIISTSGDDFFVPDSSALYLPALPGETRTRVVPNQSHYIDMKIVEETLLPWYKKILAKEARPNIYWENYSNHPQVAITEGRPTQIKLWQATNTKNCDLRYNAGIRYEWVSLQSQEKCAANLCQYAIDLEKNPQTGCRASFVEATFGEIIITTPVFIQKSERQIS